MALKLLLGQGNSLGQTDPQRLFDSRRRCCLAVGYDGRLREVKC
jgi:hypothetical protein